MGFYVNKAEEFESVIEDNIREGRTKIENDKCKEYLSTLSTLTDENKERKLFLILSNNLSLFLDSTIILVKKA